VEWLQGLGAWVWIAFSLLILVWSVFWFCVPFFIYAIYKRLVRLHEDLYAQIATTNRILGSIAGDKSSGQKNTDLGTPENPFH